MGVVFNDKFMSYARVVSRSDYVRCQSVQRLFVLPETPSKLFVYTQIQIDENKKIF